MDMTKQKMSEWLAEHVLGWEILDLKMPDGSDNPLRWQTGFLQFPVEDYFVHDYLFVPAGFFAVWDAVDKRRGAGWSTIFKAYEDGDFICTFEFLGKIFCMGKGKDRYKAFYNAVYEATKTPAK